MDLDQAHTLLTSTTKKLFNPNFNVCFIIHLIAFLLFLFVKVYYGFLYCVKVLLGFFFFSCELLMFIHVLGCSVFM